MSSDEKPRDSSTQAPWIAVSAAFGALGRAFLCLDGEFRILHASTVLDDLLGPGAAAQAEGSPVERLLGADLLGPGAPLRQALLAQERREGWRASLPGSGETPRLVSVTAAPIYPPAGACDPRVSYIVVLRPSEEEPLSAGAPTTFGGLIARSAAMSRIFRLIENLAHSDATVLLTGESGTGKEMVARAIHTHSLRHGGRFVAVNCGALPGELLESELFGHVRGAFTGAVRDRDGRFEAASGGTLFLDEVGDIPQPLQVKLLRALQERTFERVGENRTRQTDARMIAATNRDLRRGIAEGWFREDLYYRLRVVPIEIPPLRERREDVEPLARALLARVGARQGRALRFSPEALRAILRNDWPGNVRELENVLEYAVAVCHGQTILPEDLPAEIADSAVSKSIAQASEPRESSPQAERLRKILEEHHWRRGEAARALGVSRTTLWRMMREAGLGSEATDRSVSS